MSRTPRQIDEERATVAAILLVSQHALNGAPCPGRDEFMAQTGLPQRAVRPFLIKLQERRLIEIECRGDPPAHLWRMRVNGGPWTEWTQRRKSRKEEIRAGAAGLGYD